jgi:hypothetical protein
VEMELRQEFGTGLRQHLYWRTEQRRTTAAAKRPLRESLPLSMRVAGAGPRLPQRFRVTV